MSTPVPTRGKLPTRTGKAQVKEVEGRLARPLATLTAGTHHVMFTATDWDGQQAIATVTVIVPGTAGRLYLPLVQH